jgi:hypothetical protein
MHNCDIVNPPLETEYLLSRIGYDSFTPSLELKDYLSKKPAHLRDEIVTHPIAILNNISYYAERITDNVVLQEALRQMSEILRQTIDK